MRGPFLALALVGSLGCSCGEDGNGPIGPRECEEIPPDAEGTLHRDETITTSAVWEAEGSPHRVEGVVRVAGTDGSVARLEVRRCSRVEFGEGASLVVGDEGSGMFTARGDPSDQIRFVPADDGAAPGSWVGVVFGPRATSSRLENVTVEGAGGESGRPEGDAAILAWGDETDAPRPLLQGVSVLSSAADGISLSGAGFHEDSRDLDILGAAGHPIVTDASDAGTVPAGAYRENGIDALGVRGGTIDGRIVWPPGPLPYHVLGDVLVEGDDVSSLLVSPGVAIWFDEGSSLRVGETLPGGLVATADMDTRIVLSGVDGDATPGSWRGIVVGPEAGIVQFEAVTIAGAGGPDPEGGEAAALLVRGRGETGPTVEIHDLRIEGTAGFGLSVLEGARLDPTSTFLRVHDGADYMVHVGAAAAGTLPSDIAGERNARPGILVEPGTVSTNAEWRVREIPYVVAGPVVVEGLPAPLLEIHEGATLRFQEGASLVVGRDAQGDVRVAGTPDYPIVLTADAGEIPGSWIGVLLLSGITNQTVFSRVTVEYGGAENDFSGETCGSSDTGNFVIVDAPLEFVAPPFAVVHDTVIRGSAGYGIAMDRDLDADLTTVEVGNTFEDNALGDQTPSGC